ncbi:MAG TPA: sialidase family protein [Gammaproteobacteria bacterium]
MTDFHGLRLDLRSRLGNPLRCAAAAVLVAAAGCSGDDVAPQAPVPQAAIQAPVELDVPAGPGSGQARLSGGPDGPLVLSWLEPAGDGMAALRFSVLGGDGWGEPRTVVTGDDLVVNWADFPSVVPITSDVLIAHWLRAAPDSFEAYDIAYATSGDGGRTFVEHGLLNDDGALTEHGFVSLFPWDGAIGAIWLDGRRLAELFESGDFDPDGPPVGMSLRFAKIAYDGTVGTRGEIDELVCDCCTTGATLAGAAPVIVYRDRSPEEIRDIAVRRYAGAEWSDPVVLGPDGWRIEGCPVNGPAIAADGETVVAAWFTAPDGRPRVRAARSTDGGRTFGAALDVDLDGSFGYVDVALLDGGDALVSWWRRGAQGEIELALRRIGADGTLGEPRAVATAAVAQPVDVPQLAIAGDAAIVAWTDPTDERVRTMRVPLR